MSTFLLTMTVIAAGIVIVLGVRPLRHALISRRMLALYRRIMPQMSDTERDAIEAGTVWWEAELFRGKPDWSKLHAIPKPTLTQEERDFLDNEVEVACAMIDDWHVTRELHDMPQELWQYIKENRFLSLIIPKEYGGRGFSALAHSQVITKLSTRNSALSVSVMVPNSLGPAELLLHYGTDEQKSHYLPRLAIGEEIPAFALTSPWAGSDAAAIPDSGIVCMGQWQGREVLGMRVTWDKRYITLAPVCTLLGLAFRLYDPEGLLGTKKDIGITCALVPATHPGVETGRRHFPLDAMFMNGPTRGTNVFMPLDFIIGGPQMAGQGWRMLMESLAAGRSISLPSSFTGMAKMTSRAVGAYCLVRTQFRTPIGKFEGVEEALARIGGNTYLIDAARSMTAVAVDLGEKPSVVSAIVKYHLTERGRSVVNDGMDIIGGKGICLGPQNFLGRAYQQIPVGITVEGANILTRSLIIFGQGAIRCHPYVLAELHAANHADPEKALHDFDQALCGHVRYTMGNVFRSLGLALTAGRFSWIDADVAPEMQVYYRLLNRYSSAFAVFADTSMLVLGGSLKRRERLSARMGDILSQMYLISATLKRFDDDGRQADDASLAHWAIQDAMYKLQEAIEGVLKNFPNRAVAWGLRMLVFPFGHPVAPPSDELGQAVARLLTKPGAARDRLTHDCYVPQDTNEPIGVIEAAFMASVGTESIDRKIRQFEKTGQLDNNPAANVRDIAQAVHAAGGITDDEYESVRLRNALRDRVIAVDDFPFDLRSASQQAPAPERNVA
ncbi:acyl-CoA dehydrogenase [Pollutimonas nitritireducens]|uniref:Acyl-coenzyme A dehydrogenase n=1 Tax=Pollutimonas nitritireducens TaxID=2045209 RepID=A0A2N4UL73_9BURK|nr:acyl-CoA dehydrogenase [Pollutimonas nitritireducens]PLC55773.1 acyl-CoA dehydrogenase [Pollutimonas nitritireducens]